MSDRHLLFLLIFGACIQHVLKPQEAVNHEAPLDLEPNITTLLSATCLRKNNATREPSTKTLSS